MGTEKNPVAEYLTTKQAGFGSAARGFGQGFAEQATSKGFGGATANAAMGAGIGMGLTGIAALGTMAATKLYDAATKARDFRVMLENNADLAEKHKENPRQFNQMFSTLRNMNPEFSRDPLVAGSYMRQMVEDPMHAGGKAVEALNFRDKAQSPVSKALLEGVFRKGTSAQPPDPLAGRKAQVEGAELEHKQRMQPLKNPVEEYEASQKMRSSRQGAQQMGLPFPS